MVDSKLLVKNIIANEGVLQCSGEFYSFESSSYVPICARLKILSFDKIEYEEIDGLAEFNASSNVIMKRIEVDEGALWLMRVELVNTTPTPFIAFALHNIINLKDDDGFSFNPILCNHIMLYSRFSDTSGLKRIYGGNNMLKPGKKAIGAFMFQLPDDNSVNYFISANEGKIELI